MAKAEQRGRKVAFRIAIATAIAIGALAGWALGLDFPTRLLPGSLPMNPLAAVAVLSGGLSIGLLRNGPAQGWRLWLSRSGGSLVLVIALLELLSCLAGLAIVPPDPLSGETSHGLVPADPLEAVSLLLLGTGLLLTDGAGSGTVMRHPQWITAPIMPITMYCLSDYLYEGAHMVDHGAVRPMGLSTAVAMVEIMLAIWLSRPDQGPMSLIGIDSPGSRMIRYMLLVAAFLPTFIAGGVVIGIDRHWFAPDRGLALAVLWSVISIAAVTIAISSRLQMLDNLRRKTVRELREREARERDSTRHTEALMTIEDILRAFTRAPGEMADRLLAFLAEFTTAPQLCLYMVEDSSSGEPELTVMSCYADGRFPEREQRIALGDGLPGQCALTMRRLVMEQVPQDYFRHTLGADERLPQHLLLLPLSVAGNPVGVLELAWLTPPTEAQYRFLEQACRAIAFALSRQRDQARTQRLLEALASTGASRTPAGAG